MRLVVQRVSSGKVRVGDEIVGAIDGGLVVLVGVEEGDQAADVSAAAVKLAGLRIFADAEGLMNLSVSDVGGGVLLVSQFTLAADVRKGRRPSFTRAAEPGRADELIASLATALEGEGLTVATGSFGARMTVELVNEGPVTIVIDVSEGRGR
jgi:D-tyrosyl-tRNA(Tyr) deacylase